MGIQTKTTRAFRTISEAGEELDLQPHVLRFWESKFSDIKPIKRGGGRRFYRPEDIEFIRGIKILLYDEGHQIKDVQKLIKSKGADRVSALGRSVEKASRERELRDTTLVPARIKKSKTKAKSKTVIEPMPVPEAVIAPEPVAIAPEPITVPTPAASEVAPPPPTSTSTVSPPRDVRALKSALARLESLRSEWDDLT